MFVTLAVIGLLFGFWQSMMLHASRGFRSDAGWSQTIAETYCEASHPMETRELVNAGANQSTCERQHIVQQRDDLCRDTKECDLRTVWWSERLHTKSDRRGERSVVNDNPGVIAFTNDNALNLRAAYKLGTYGLQWHVLFIDYGDRTNVDFVAFKFDAISNLLYFYSWLVNTPQKLFTTIEFGVWLGHWDVAVDGAFALVLFVAIELPLALFCTVIGVVGGVLIHPINTVTAIPGGAYLALITTWSAVANFF